MATVTRKFRDDFEAWSAAALESGDWTPADMEEFKDMLRKDLASGPDQLRDGLTFSALGIETPATIDDHEERYRLWAAHFHTAAMANPLPADRMRQ